ncbi:TPA: BPSL0761 family protein [Pseudomonas aeruginosa]
MGSKAAALVDLSTVAGNKISNPPWVKFQSAGWVNFPSAPTIVQTRDFLQELARDTSLPESVRYQAKNLLRHYPTAEAVWLAGRVEERSKQELSLLADKHGPLHPVLVSWLLNDPMFSDHGAS